MPLFLFSCLGYYIFSQFNFFGNVQLLLLGVAMTDALSAHLYMHAVYICVYLYLLYVYDYFQIFGSMECENKLQLQLQLQLLECLLRIMNQSKIVPCGKFKGGIWGCK